MKFIIISEFGEILDVALRLQDEEYDVLLYITEDQYKSIGDGLIEKCTDWYSHIGQDYIWIFDGCNNGKLQDWLRENGESVFGGSEGADLLENDRQEGQKLFKECGFDQPESHNFTDFDEAIDFVNENNDRLWILKQNGDAPKHLNHMGKFEGCRDMLFHLDQLKRQWNEAEFGPVDFDLMEIVSGMEVAASAFFNGNDWMRDKDGKIVGYLNWEEKKECDGGLGETTGETGTTFLGVNEDNELFSTILDHDVLKKKLSEVGFHGIFDINGMLTDEGDYVAFEATCRFGVPSTSYELLHGLETPLGEFIEAIAKGNEIAVDIKNEIGMVLVITSKPYPNDGFIEDQDSSRGERLWLLEDGNLRSDQEMTKSDRERIHLENFKMIENENEEYLTVATKNGYLLTVTNSGDDLDTVREELLDFVKDTIYIPGMKYRTDIGKRCEDFINEQIS